MNIKESIGVAVGCVALLGTGYAAALKGGWLVDDARAQEIAQQAVAPEERALLEFMRETKFSRLRFLNGLGVKSTDDMLEMETLRDDIKRINDRLEELR